MSDPRTTAVLFVECQRGVVGDHSVLPALAEAARPALDAMGRLAAGARSAGATVVHLTYLPLAGGRTASGRTRLMRATRAATSGWHPAHPAYEIVPEVGVGADDLLLPRHQGISPVHRTEVLTILRNLGIDEVVVAGVSTNLAVLLTAVGAADEDFAVTVATDACVGTPASHHASVLEHSLAFVARLTTVDELRAEWAAA